MYNLSVYSTVLHNRCNVFNMYLALIDANLISEPKVFYDKNTIVIKPEIPSFHAWHLCSAKELVLSDNTVYDIAHIFPSNKFISIDIPCRHNANNVSHYSIEPFVNLTKTEDSVKLLTDILNQKEYADYVQIQQTI